MPAVEFLLNRGAAAHQRKIAERTTQRDACVVHQLLESHISKCVFPHAASELRGVAERELHLCWVLCMWATSLHGAAGRLERTDVDRMRQRWCDHIASVFTLTEVNDASPSRMRDATQLASPTRACVFVDATQEDANEDMPPMRRSVVHVDEDATQDEVADVLCTQQQHRPSTRPSTLLPAVKEPAAASETSFTGMMRALSALQTGISAASKADEALRQDREALKAQVLAKEHRISQQTEELQTMRMSLSSVKHQLMEESAAHAVQVAQLVDQVRQLTDTNKTQLHRMQLLERQLQRYEQMNAVIRSMTSEVSSSNGNPL